MPSIEIRVCPVCPSKKWIAGRVIAQLEPEYGGISVVDGKLGELSVWVDGVEAVSIAWLAHPWPSTICARLRDFLRTHIPGSPPLRKTLD